MSVVPPRSRAIRAAAAALAAGLALAVPATPAAAQPYAATLTAQCVGGVFGCGQVDFFLTLLGALPPGGVPVDGFQLTLGTPAFRFADAVAQNGGEVEDRFGPTSPVPFTPTVSPDQGTLTLAFDVFAAELEPTLRVRALFEANGVTDASTLAATAAVSTGGTLVAAAVLRPSSVVPEPGTWTLLATGLAGLVAVQRRARRG